MKVYCADNIHVAGLDICLITYLHYVMFTKITERNYFSTIQLSTNIPIEGKHGGESVRLTGT